MPDAESIGDAIALAVSESICHAHIDAHGHACPDCEPEPCPDCHAHGISYADFDPDADSAVERY